jgi:hypothetical protein
LLREALTFLPEERVTPLELAKHRWFHGEYKSKMQDRE